MTAAILESDAHVLVDTCLARLRRDAGLAAPDDDDDPIVDLELEPLSDTDDATMDVRTGELVIVCDDVKAIPSARSIVRESFENAAGKSRREVPTARTRLHARPASRWPLVFCALVATYAGLTAFFRSPVGQQPHVQHVVKASRSTIGGLWHATVATTKTILVDDD